MKKEIILTVHKSGGENHRLALSKEDISIINPSKAKNISISLGNGVIEINGALNTYKKHYNISSKEIYSWIKENGYNNYPKNKNTKLIFSVEIDDGTHHYELYSNQA